MRNIKIKALTAALIAIFAVAPVNNVFAASGSTSVTVSFPNMIVLHYQPTLTLTFTPAYDAAVAEAAGTASTTLATPATFDANIAGGALTTSSPPSTIAVTVDNQWAVRGIVGAGQNIQVAVTLDTASATSGGSTATASNARVSDGVSTGGSITFGAPGMGAAGAVYGSVLFDLDISGVTTTGAHTGMQWTITATAV